MVQSRPVHSSEVYLLSCPVFSAITPPSPPHSTPITPSEGCPYFVDHLQLDTCDVPLQSRLSGAVHVLQTEATAIQCLARLYATDGFARDAFSRAITLITERQYHGGKLVLIGVGKSGHIAKKLVATFNSLALQAVFLHPTEVLHGDLGIISPRDRLLFITLSGKTPELMQLLPHVESMPLLLLTSHTCPERCGMARLRPDTVLLSAPIHESEVTSHGVSAPTTSTTAALALEDAVALVAAGEVHHSVARMFAKNHPGGAIGAAFQAERPDVVPILAVPLRDMGHLGFDHVRAADVLQAGYAVPSRWVQVAAGVVSPTRIRQLQSEDLMRPVDEIALTPQSDCLDSG